MNVIDSFSASLIGAPEWSVSVLLGQHKGDFRGKADRFKGIIEAIAQERPVAKPNVTCIVKLLYRAKELASERNKYIHGLIVDRHSEAGTSKSSSTKAR